jgi:glycosyltransferase involved in cell wall biosynthesis
MKIAILGTRGIPNRYGGFEQITEYISEGLVQKGHEVTVYSPHNHSYRRNTWKNVTIRHCYDPEYILRTAGQFIYDLNCIRDARKIGFDVIIFMGYNSSSVWHNFFPKNTVIISNMDGLEWKRTKYSRPVQWFLRHAEKLAVRYSHFHIADSIGIQQYLQKKYGVRCTYIPYGASLQRKEKDHVLRGYGIQAQGYFLLMARMEPENNIDLILEGFSYSNSQRKFIVIGNVSNRYGKYLCRKYAKDERIAFAGAQFDQDIVHTLRKNARLYFHGHSVGGTNPSLLEAMASKALLAAHDNEFNRHILGGDAFYFAGPADIKILVEQEVGGPQADQWKNNNLFKIYEHYNWPGIVDAYDEFIHACCHREANEKIIAHRRYAFK